MKDQKGILLVNLGTPEAPTIKAVTRYLKEFLLDPRVIDMPWWKRQLVVRGLIIPGRKKSSTLAYQRIWTEKGSPLLVYGKKVQKLLQERLGSDFFVELGMRYQNPSIEASISRLLKKGLDELIILPLFPQYASATTGSILEKIFKVLPSHPVLPKIRTINSFATNPHFIEALAASALPFDLNSYDHILFSFHGLPEKQLKQADCSQFCLSQKDCCENEIAQHRFCYGAQCYATARLLAQKLALGRQRYAICFQSRLGRDPWMAPYTIETMLKLAEQGKKKLLVFCPAFAADCLETLFEIGIEYHELFLKAGGTSLDLVPCLNDHPRWIDALEKMVINNGCNLHFPADQKIRSTHSCQ